MKDPKEEAMELFKSMYRKTFNLIDIANVDIDKDRYECAKQCALIANEEKKKTLGECLEYGMEYLNRLNHLLEVETEIEKL